VPPAAAAASLSWDLPTTTTKSLDDIYAPLGYVIDPSYAQIVVSASTFVNGDTPIEHAVISIKGKGFAGCQAIIYDTAGGVFTSQATGTGPLGLAIIVNLNAAELDFPGKWFSLYVTVNGVTQGFVPQIAAVKNAVTRIYYMVGGIET
jgi:hypothetical protein